MSMSGVGAFAGLSDDRLWVSWADDDEAGLGSVASTSMGTSAGGAADGARDPECSGAAFAVSSTLPDDVFSSPMLALGSVTGSFCSLAFAAVAARVLRVFAAFDADADVDVVSLALEFRLFVAGALRLERVVGLSSGGSAASSSSAADASASSSAAPVGLTVVAPAAALGFLARLGGLGYVPSPSSTSLRRRFPPPARRLRGLACGTARGSAGRLCPPLSPSASTRAASSSSPGSRSRSFAVGLRARDEARRGSPSCMPSASSMSIGLGSPKSAGSSSGRESASEPRGWYSGRGGPMRRRLERELSSLLSEAVRLPRTCVVRAIPR